MMHRAWSSIVEVPYCFSSSYVKFQGHTALKIVEFDPNWAFPECNSSLNSPKARKCCTKLETAKEMPYCFPRSSIKFQGHTVQSITDFDLNWAFPDYRPVAAFISLRFALFSYLWYSSFKYFSVLFTIRFANDASVFLNQTHRKFYSTALYNHSWYMVEKFEERLQKATLHH